MLQGTVRNLAEVVGLVLIGLAAALWLAGKVLEFMEIRKNSRGSDTKD